MSVALSGILLYWKLLTSSFSHFSGCHFELKYEHSSESAYIMLSYVVHLALQDRDLLNHSFQLYI